MSMGNRVGNAMAVLIVVLSALYVVSAGAQGRATSRTLGLMAAPVTGQRG